MVNSRPNRSTQSRCQHLKKRMENKLEIKTRLIRTFCFSLCRPDLVSFIEDKTSALTSNTLRVASSSGIAVEVKDKLVNAFQQLGIEILGMNQCKGVEFDNNKSLEFLRGGSPTWEIYHFNDTGNIVVTWAGKIWSNGYGRQLTFERSWVRLLDGNDIISHWFDEKIVLIRRPKINIKEPRVGPF